MSRHRLEDEIKQKYGTPKECWTNVVFPDPNSIKIDKEREKLETKIRIFNARKSAFDSYFEGTPIDSILYETENGTLKKLSSSELHRWIKRCLTPKSDGHIYGYEGLIPYHRTEPYIRVKPISIQKGENKENQNIGLSGAWNEFFGRHPDIHKLIFDEYLYGGSKGGIRIKTPRAIDIYQRLLRECKKQNLYQEYPLVLDSTGNTRPGIRSFYDYVKKLRKDNYDLFAKTHLTSEAALLAKTAGNGQKLNALPNDMYSIIELDEHTIDGKFIIQAESVEGDVFEDTVDNITIITGLEVNSKAIIDYHVVPGSNPSAEDIQRCIINCIVPHQLMNFSIEGLKYPSDECFPSLISDNLKWAIWGRIEFDNAMAHKSAQLTRFLTETLKVRVTRGAVRHAVHRPNIEKFFDIFERSFTHRMVNTTGGNPNSPKRNDPIGQAIKYGITFEDAKELCEVAIANYNLTPKASNYGMSPIQTLKSRLSRGRMPQILPIDVREDAIKIVRKVTVPVLGNEEKGRNPYVNYQYARYTSPIFAQSKYLLNSDNSPKTKITLEVNVDDARYAAAYRSNGTFIDTLTANGAWGVIKHSLQLRTYLVTRRSKGEISFTDQDDFIDVYFQHLLQKGNSFERVKNLVERNTTVPITTTINDIHVEPEDEIAITDLLPKAVPKISEVQTLESVYKLEESGIFDDIY